MSRSGAIVDQISIPEPVPGQLNEQPRDLIVDSAGRVQLFLGQVPAWLYTFDLDISSVPQKSQFPGWNTVSNVRYGGIATYGNYLYLADQAFLNDTTDGIIRVDLSDNSYTRFYGDSFTSFAHLAMGLNGRLYALPSSGHGIEVHIYDPRSMILLEKVQLTRTLQGPLEIASGLAVDVHGNMFAAAGQTIFRFDSSGQEVSRLNVNIGLGDRFGDLNIHPDGSLVAGSDGSDVVLTNTAFSALSVFNVPGLNFVAWVVPPVPEPSSLVLFVLGGVLVSVRRYRYP